MDDSNGSINYNINNISKQLGGQNEVIIRNFIIGKKGCIEATIIYINGLVNKDIIDRDILNPLMLHVDEDLINFENVENYIYKKYIAVSNTYIETDINKVVDSIKRGKTVLLIQDSCNFILIDTTGGVYRAVTEPGCFCLSPRKGILVC